MTVDELKTYRDTLLTQLEAVTKGALRLEGAVAAVNEIITRSEASAPPEPDKES